MLHTDKAGIYYAVLSLRYPNTKHLNSGTHGPHSTCSESPLGHPDSRLYTSTTPPNTQIALICQSLANETQRSAVKTQRSWPELVMTTVAYNGSLSSPKKTSTPAISYSKARVRYLNRNRPPAQPVPWPSPPQHPYPTPSVP